MQPKRKVEILMFLDELGNIGCNFTSTNLVTVLGIIELAKHSILTQKKTVEEKPLIEVPRFNP